MGPPNNVRVYAEGLTQLDKQPFWHAAVANITLLAYCGTVNGLILLGLASFYSSTATFILIAAFSTLLLPAKPFHWRAFLKLKVFSYWREYFRFSYCFEEKLDLHKGYILYKLPHGVFPIAPVLAASLVQTLFPDAPVYSLAADSVFSV
ncbi:hypothetical protein DUNSADRAFT_18654 [Dunaliella salina]|uniref:Uncharacterized protein n=1 Tax=Dunaliella salina TaxID=3046 RepID=A0ABQ7GYU4_DUNSA|nr:hypothetical protein DUNSADRAFT_18654 [Dunaliella salina]|eukprot:KAF5839776.1 hypothetical protein DUNSADRAFT_18654 [Dunaliella salina]